MVSEYPLRRLGDLTVNFDGKRVPVKEADRLRGPYPYYGASGIVDYVDGHLFDGEYLLIAEDGENLRTRQTPIAFMAKGKFWVNNHAHVVQANEDNYTRYLMYALQVADIHAYLSGSTLPKLTQRAMNQIPVSAPDKSEQESIARILGALDDKMELNRKMNETLEGIARAIFKSWFVDFDPVRAKSEGRDPGLPSALAGLFPSSFVDSELGEIPEGWTTRAIGDVVQVLGGGTPSTKLPQYWVDGTHPFCTPKDMAGLAGSVLLDTERYLTDEGLLRVSSGQLPAGVVLLSSRAPIGYLAVAETPVSVNQGIIAMVCDKALPNLYVRYWTEANMDGIVARANGSTFLEISKTNFRPIRVIVPHKRVLDDFMKCVSPLHARTVVALRETEQLTNIRDSLLPKLISGELRVPDAETDVAEALP